MRTIAIALLLVACKTDKPSQEAPAPTAASAPAPTPTTPPAAPTAPAAVEPPVTSPEPPPPAGPSVPPEEFAKADPGVTMNAPASQSVVDAMKTFCALGDLSPPDRVAGTQKWLAANQSNPELGELWLKMAQGDAAASTKLRNAAEAAVGAGKCGVLDALIDAAARARAGSGAP